MGSYRSVLGLVALASCATRESGMIGAITQADGAGWTGTWAVSPQGCGDTFTKQTLRHIVHTSIDGTSARVRISNAFGGQALHVADVHIAKSAGDSAIELGSDHPVTFGGKSDV